MLKMVSGKPRLRLCFVSDPLSIHVRRWIGYFLERGHEIHIISSRSPSQVSFPGANLHQFRALDLGRLARVLSRILYTRRLVRRLAPDILHVQYISAGGWSGALAGWRPMVISGWGSDVHTFPRRSRLTHLLTRFALRRADLATCQSAYLRNEMIKLGAPADRTHLIMFGVDMNIFRTAIDSSAKRTRLGLPNAPIVFSPRPFAPIYNIDAIVRAIPLVLARVPDAVFLLLDYLPPDQLSDYRRQIEGLLHELNVTHAVRVIGAVPPVEMAALYNLAHAIVSVPSGDDFAATYQEAMACGTPIIASDLPAYRGWITHEHNGMLVEPRDERGLAAAIVQLLQHDELRAAFRRRNLELAREKLDLNLWMQRVEDLYYDLVTHDG
jgi:glycosyltransferase involved in cell wall biosynthesis